MSIQAALVRADSGCLLLWRSLSSVAARSMRASLSLKLAVLRNPSLSVRFGADRLAGSGRLRRRPSAICTAAFGPTPDFQSPLANRPEDTMKGCPVLPPRVKTRVAPTRFDEGGGNECFCNSPSRKAYGNA